MTAAAEIHTNRKRRKRRNNKKKDPVEIGTLDPITSANSCQGVIAAQSVDQPTEVASQPVVRVEVDMTKCTPPAKSSVPVKDCKNKRSLKKKPRKSLTINSRNRVVLNALADAENGALAYPASDAAGTCVDTTDSNYTSKLGKAWSKRDLATLTKLAKDRKYLQECIPQHPLPPAEVDFELISKLLHRYSPGGCAVRHQWAAIQRIDQERNLVGRKGINYMDLVKEVLQSLPDGMGSVLDIQRVLRSNLKYAKYLDKHRSNLQANKIAWKAAVTKCLRDCAVFKKCGKGNNGKFIYRLTENETLKSRQEQSVA